MIEIKQVGKRWFICTGKGINVEASRSVAIRCVKSKDENGKQQYEWKEKTIYTLTGKGARSKREEIEKAIEDYLEGKRLERFSND